MAARRLRSLGLSTARFVASLSYLHRSCQGRRFALFCLQPEHRQQRIGFAEPGAFAATLVRWHRRSLVDYFLGPLARFLVAALRVEEERVIVVGLGTRGDFCGLPKKRIRLFWPSGLGIGMGQQSDAAIEVIIRISLHGSFKIGHGRGKVAQSNLRDTSPIKWVDRI